MKDGLTRWQHIKAGWAEGREEVRRRRRRRIGAELAPQEERTNCFIAAHRHLVRGGSDPHSAGVAEGLDHAISMVSALGADLWEKADRTDAEHVVMMTCENLMNGLLRLNTLARAKLLPDVLRAIEAGIISGDDPRLIERNLSDK